ncbi:MAG TPA: putative ABC exporter domain-containing protein [Gemmatimonadales bacterium]|nr:putative ABC exporter domain-containing protein [Gemmatimonadales bacterium]
MIGAALYLSRRSLVNATRRRVARLRQPKYLIAFLVGCFYIYWLAFRRQSGAAIAAVGTPAGDVWAVGVLAVLLVVNWLFGSAETPFPFTLAETQYLFTAPLTRREVIDFKLLRSQLPLLISAAVTALFLTGGQLNELRVFHVIGLWLVYDTLQLHYAGVALLRGSLTQHGVAGVRRRLGTLLVLGTAVTLVGWDLHRALPDLLAAFQRDPRDGFAALSGAMHTGWLGVAVWPLEAVLGPLRAPTTTTFAARLPAALLVLAVHYVWVVRSALAFEEAAVEHAVKVARRVEALRRGRSPGQAITTPKSSAIRLRLAPTGAPSLAIFWKNAVGALRDSSPRTFLVLTVLLIAVSVVIGGAPLGGPDVVAVVLLALGGGALLLGPLAVRFDLRQDLEMLDVLKTYPMRGYDVVRGEVTTPIVLLGSVVWICLGAGFLVLATAHTGVRTVGEQLVILFALLPTTIAILGVLVLVQNAAVLLFPGWLAVGRNRPVGLEAAGQRILLAAGGLVALAVALAPAILVGGLIGAAVHAAGADLVWTAAVGSVSGAVVVGFEGVLAIHLLGGVFDRMEPGPDDGG